MVHDAVEGSEAEEAGADVGVEVAVGGEGGFAVVHYVLLAKPYLYMSDADRLTVKCFQILRANSVIERIDRLLESLWRSQIIACRKGMTSVDANSHTILIFNHRNDIPKILPRRTNYVPTACHILQNSDDRLSRLMRLIQLGCDPLNRCRPDIATGVSRVEVV